MKPGAPEIIYNGRKMVTVAEFANRKGVTRYAINYHIKNGNLFSVRPNGYKTQYMDWETQSLAYDTLATRSMGKGKEPDKYMKAFTQPKITTPRLESAEDLKLPTSDIKTEPVENLSYINPDDHPDCWFFDNDGKPAINPATKQKVLDYDRLKTKLVSQKYQFDFDKDRGKYISKDEVIRTAQGMSKIIASYLDSIPQRYGAIITAQVTKITGHEFTPEENVTIRNILIDSGTNTLESIRKEFLKLMEEDND